MDLVNWAGNVRFRAERIATPASVDDVCAILSGPGPFRALGSGHSFSLIADTDGTLISTAGLAAAPVVDAQSRTVTVGAGIRYGELARALEAEGWALANLASLPHISVAGAVATGTHGSGDAVGTLSSAVAALELVVPGGDVVRLRRGDPAFDAAVVSLGALGVVTSITLDIEPSFEVRQRVYENLPLETALADFDALMGAAYSVSLFLRWGDRDVVDQVWTKSRSAEPPVLPGDPAPAAGPVHMLAGVSPAACTPQLGEPGRWLDRLAHFRLSHTPSAGAELQSEHLVPRRHAVAAIRAVRELADRIAPLIQVTEIRSMRADSLWLSPAYETDAVGLHFTWLPDQPAVEAVVAEIEAALAPFQARPHWGKLSAMDAAGRAAVWPRLREFAALTREFDPEGRLRNPYLSFLDEL
ncbi:FAD-binding protein [Microbacterium sp. MEC084]|jgi:xylitol oxidase|uniref:FAD-binding protein n=1 Tax=unclassified Microbacterium TaxID=2609290 RepID=UPI0006FD911A|nr:MULTISPECIES: FAD-binding protein [unclassified Microbacterium]KQY97559.1 FAD-binding protein [Microbacterium sp. Root53]MCD1268374.1 FAD-binding protein [Microbacterium sp. MEC084]